MAAPYTFTWPAYFHCCSKMSKKSIAKLEKWTMILYKWSYSFHFHQILIGIRLYHIQHHIWNSVCSLRPCCGKSAKMMFRHCLKNNSMCIFQQNMHTKKALERTETPVLSCQGKRVLTGPIVAAHIRILVFLPVAFFHAAWFFFCVFFLWKRYREVNPAFQ